MNFIDQLFLAVWFTIGPLPVLHDWLKYEWVVFTRLIFWKLFGDKHQHCCGYCTGHKRKQLFLDTYICRFKPRYSVKNKHEQILELYKPNHCNLWRERKLFLNH